MNHIIKCLVCGMTKTVNGQSKISQFTGEHKHGNQFAGQTGENVEFVTPDNKIQPLITHGHYNPNDTHKTVTYRGQGYEVR